MDLTIVIATYNRAHVLQRLLTKLRAQTDKDFQVVVAIDGSTDGTEEMLKRLEPRFDLKWVNTHCTGYGLAVARNQGIIEADGEAVVVLDDDSFPVEEFVGAHKSSVEQGTITGGPRIPGNLDDAHLSKKMRELGRLPSCSPIRISRLFREWPRIYLIENNICLYRKDWIDIGLFSERVKLYGFIGQEFFARAKYLGYRFQYNPDAAVRHHGQLEGNNGFGRRMKRCHIRIAEALRPTLLAPRYFDGQIEWARQISEGHDTVSALPRFYLQAGLAFPFRVLRNSARSLKREVIQRLR